MRKVSKLLLFLLLLHLFNIPFPAHAEYSAKNKVIGVNNTPQLHKRNKDVIYLLRKGKVDMHKELGIFPSDYRPDNNVFGQIDDNAEWLNDTQFYISNPYLLVLSTGASYVNPLLPFSKVASVQYTFKKIDAVYKGESAALWFQYVFDHYGKESSGLIHLWFPNANDAGFRYASLDMSRSTNVEAYAGQEDAIGKGIYSGNSFFHRGASGRNNLSPEDKRAWLRVSKRGVKTVMYIKLWKNKPANKDAQEEFAYVITIDPGNGAVASDIDASKFFTITDLSPDLHDRSLNITFSESCNQQDIRRALRIFPSTWFEWPYYDNAQRSGYTIKGNFNAGQTYTIALPEGFKCNGLEYRKTNNTLKMPDMASDIDFVEKGNVIERESRQMLHANLVNVDELQVQGVRVPPATVPLISGISDYERAKEIVRRAKANPALKEFYGDIVEDKQLFFAGKGRNEKKPFSIPLTFRKDKEKGGIEFISVKSNRNDQPAGSAERLFRITDIGLTYKISRDSMMVWATSLNTGRPIKDLSLLAVAGKNTALPLGKTDKDGALIISKIEKLQRLSIDLNEKEMETPKSFWDIDYLIAASPLDSTYVILTSSDFAGADWVKQSKELEHEGRSFRGHVFTERGIYRPGETAHFKGSVREYKNGAIIPPSDMEPTFQVVNAKGENVYDSKLKLSEFGTASGALTIKPYFPLGTYTINMKFGGKQDEIVSRTFQVQEFQPPRHFTEIIFRPEKKKDKRYINLDKDVSYLRCDINGTYYAGGPVKNGKVRWKAYYSGSSFNKKDYREYTFGNMQGEDEQLLESGESVLNEKGTISVNVPMNKNTLSGLYTIKLIATVVDFDGKVSTENSVYQETPEYLVGIGKHKPSIRAGDAESLNIVVIGKDNKKVEKGKVGVEVMKKGFTSVRKRNEAGNVYWTEMETWRKELSADIVVEDGKALFDFDFINGGEYLLKFTYAGVNGKGYTSSTRYSVQGYYYGYEHDNKERSFERLAVSAEQDEYSPGETARIYITPRKKLSSILMTVERDGVIEYKNVEVSPGKRYIDIPVKKSYAPNVYVSFVGTVARGEFPVYNGEFDDEAPTFLYGVVNIKVRKDVGELEVAISEELTELRTEPGSDYNLKLLVRDLAGTGVRSELAVAVVDESVLAMTGFETPRLDTLNDFITPLSVFTGDVRAALLRQTPFNYIGNEDLTGGDGIERKSEAATSKVRQDFNPVAYFNPSVVTNDRGEAEVSFKLPDTMTTYRVYVVACDKGSRFASTQRGLLVVKDFYLEPGVPRFFTRGDRFKMFVSAFNKTAKSAPVSFSVEKDELVAMSVQSLNYQVNSMDRTLIPVDGQALKPGVSKLLFKGGLNGKSDAVEMSVPVNSGYLMMTDAVYGTVNKGTKIKYDYPAGTEKINWSDLKPDEVKVLLSVSGSPFIRMSQGLRYLLKYPYGCVEQTSSGVMPLAGLRSLTKDGLLPGITLEETDKFLKPGIERLLSMQTQSGGFGYWPGNLYPHKWGTIYAATALTNAKLAGFEVPADQMNLVMSYLKGAILESGNDNTFTGFAAYILALNNSLDEQTFRTAYSDINKMSREGALLILLSAKIKGYLPDQELKNQARPLLERRWNGKSSDVFYARYREPAISLIAGNAIMPGDQVVGNIAKQIIGGVNKEGIWSSTSDTGWSLLALGQYFRGTAFADRPLKVTIRQEGWPETAVTIDPKKSYTYMLEPSSFLKRPEVTVYSENDLNLVYNLTLTYPRVDYASTGYSNGFRINKTIENTDGSKEIKVGDIVKVTLDIDIDGHDFKYLVLDDPLPAGFVAINTAIKTEEHVDKSQVKKKQRQYSEGEEGEGEYSDEGDYYYSDGDWNYQSGVYNFVPNYFEIRDDRVLAFKDQSWRGRYQYSYYARAVCEGEFTMPSTKIQLMYDPDTVSYTPVSKVVIKGRE